MDDKNPPARNRNLISLKLTPFHTANQLRREKQQRRLFNVGQEEQRQPPNKNQRRRRRDEAVQVGALFEGYGTHYVDLWCGTPPQRQTVVVDTGSSVTAFPCGKCVSNCDEYHTDGVFKEEDSTTFRESTCFQESSAECILMESECQYQHHKEDHQCTMKVDYDESLMWHAREVIDSCYFGGPHETPLVVTVAAAAANNNNNNNNHSTTTRKQKTDILDPRHAPYQAFDMVFGCMDEVHKLARTSLADGIMGMSNHPSTFWSQMFEAGKMGPNQQFALCFSRPPVTAEEKEGTEAGAMTLGGADTRFHDTPMVYTPTFEVSRHYFQYSSSNFGVKVRRVMLLREGIYGESVKSSTHNNKNNPNHQGVVVVLETNATILNSEVVIIDSGTPDTYWNRKISPEFWRTFEELSGFSHSNRPINNMSQEDVASLPTILFQLYGDDETNNNSEFDETTTTTTTKKPPPGLAMDPENPYDVILAIPPSHYMEYNPRTDQYSFRFYLDNSGPSVLGANAMMGHDVLFDVTNKRIGWAESSCDYTSRVQAEGYSFEINGVLKDTVEEVGGGWPKTRAMSALLLVVVFLVLFGWFWCRFCDSDRRRQQQQRSLKYYFERSTVDPSIELITSEKQTNHGFDDNNDGEHTSFQDEPETVQP